MAAPWPAGYCSWRQKCLSLQNQTSRSWISPCEGQNLSISWRPFKRSTVWICTWCSCRLCLVFNFNRLLCGCFSTLHTKTGSVFVMFCLLGHHASAVFRTSISRVLLCVSFPTRCETEWSPRLKIVRPACGWCHVLWWAGLVHTKWFKRKGSKRRK